MQNNNTKVKPKLTWSDLPVLLYVLGTILISRVSIDNAKYAGALFDPYQMELDLLLVLMTLGMLPIVFQKKNLNLTAFYVIIVLFGVLPMVISYLWEGDRQ